MRLPPPPSEITSILDDLRRVVRVLRESSRSSEREFGVTGAQLFALKALAKDPALSLNELAARTRTHQSSVSVVVKRLVRARLVSRVTSPHDGRRVELAVTAKGRALLARAPLAAQERLIEGIEQLSRVDRRVLARSLHRLVDAMQLGDEPPSMFFEIEPPARRPPTRARRG
jgi:DNA-binding MarR family transcriptional regulator